MNIFYSKLFILFINFITYFVRYSTSTFFSFSPPSFDSTPLFDFFAEVSATSIATNKSAVNNIHNLNRKCIYSKCIRLENVKSSYIQLLLINERIKYFILSKLI